MMKNILLLGLVTVLLVGTVAAVCNNPKHKKSTYQLINGKAVFTNKYICYNSQLENPASFDAKTGKCKTCECLKSEHSFK
jgi:hypothetical protein